jgi:hypothetical protein
MCILHYKISEMDGKQNLYVFFFLGLYKRGLTKRRTGGDELVVPEPNGRISHIPTAQHKVAQSNKPRAPRSHALPISISFR